MIACYIRTETLPERGAPRQQERQRAVTEAAVSIRSP
jgi:hypothetical protein